MNLSDIIYSINLIHKQKGGDRLIDTNALRKKIDDSGISITYIAGKIGITREGFYNKLNNITEFKASEIVCLSQLLHLSDNDRNCIFFGHLNELNL